MTTFEAILIGIIWLITGILLFQKWLKVDDGKSNIEDTGFIFMTSIVFCPLVLLGAIIRQVFIEDWR